MTNKAKVFHGKHGVYQQTNFYGQSGGSVPKFRSEVHRTREERRLRDEKMSFIEKIETWTGEAVKEKILLDFYSTLANTPPSRIALQKEDHCNNLIKMHFTHAGNDENVVVELTDVYSQALPKYGTFDDDKYHITFMSKMLNNYSDLGSDFVNYIETHHRPREFVIKDGKEYPLDGLMEIAAIAKILGDPDWLGGSGGNTGFVIKTEQDGHARAKAVIVDAGMGLPDHPIRQGPESKNIQIGNAAPAQFDIHFDHLTGSQKNSFIGTLYKFINCDNLDTLIEFIVKREEAFNSQKDVRGNIITLLADADAEQMITKIKNNLERLSQTYSEELALYKASTNQSETILITDFNIVIPESEAEQVAVSKPEQVAVSKPEQVAVSKPEQVAVSKPEQVAVPKPEQVAALEPLRVAAPEPEPRQNPPARPANNSSWWPMLKTGAAALTLGATIAAVAYIGSRYSRSNNI
ncbi:hypothetical protein Lsan_1043 [Legionella santicrucis]|uniref:Uncharacterized protein n=1 Tax=Legionella santicrucis TaxID=45074 RepID=A0A0W0Z395_9GAMM|nr:hypothetical protein Lsan_1043 [Legionella santicrucis]